MQDNYNIDEQFMNQAWDDMEVLLDQEMPVPRKKRRGFAWWWFFGATITVALLMALVNFDFWQTENNSFELPEIEKPAIVPATKNVPKTHKAEVNQIIAEKEDRTPIARQTNVSLRSEVQNESIVELNEKQYSSGKKTERISTIPVNESIASGAELVETKKELSQISSESIARIEVTPPLSELSVSLLNPLAKPLITASNTVIVKKQNLQWRHGIGLSSQVDFSNKPNVQLAYFAQLETNKWRISTGLGIADFKERHYTQNQNSSLYADSEEIETNTNLDLDNPYDPVTVSTRSQVSFIPASTAIVLPITLAYRVNRFQVFGQFQTHYRLSKGFTTEYSNSMDSYTTTSLSSRWEHQLGGGLGYDINEHWNVNMSYHHKLKYQKSALQIGLQYHFR